MPHHQLFQTEWNSTLQIKYRFLKKYVATIMEKINGQTPKNGVVFDTTSNVQPI